MNELPLNPLFKGSLAMATSTSSQPTLHPPLNNQAAYTTPPNSQDHPQYSLLPQQQQPPLRQGSPTASNPHSHPQTPTPNSPASPQPNLPTSNFLNLPLKRSNRPSDDLGRAPYLPAALRPTDPPPRSQPLTPPRSVHGSTDSLDKKFRPSRPASRRSTTDPFTKHPPTPSANLSHIPPSELTLALNQTSDLTPVAGYPTRDHWKPDASASICDFPICQKAFGIWERRHHCRHCGNVFCSQHSADRIPLDQEANFHPKGENVRVCGHCARGWTEWIEQRVRSVREGSHGSQEGQGDGRRTDPVGVSKKGEGSSDGLKAGSVVAGSVSVGGDWSTF